MEIILKESDFQYLREYYPDMHVRNGVIEGLFPFSYSFQDDCREDIYRLQISLQTHQNSMLPIVKEVWGRILWVQRRKGKRLEDLHINADGSLCLCINEEEEKYFSRGFTLECFFNNILIPGLYQHSYYEEHGLFPIWEYSHGYLWYLELFVDEKIDLDRLVTILPQSELEKYCAFKKHYSCLCWSGKPLKDCHPELLKVITILREYLWIKQI